MKAQLTEAEFDRLVRLSQAVSLIEAQSRVDLAAATAKRNAYYSTLAEKHQLPPLTSNVTMGFDEDTLTIDVTAMLPKGTP